MHRNNAVDVPKFALANSYRCYNTPVGIVFRVENECSQRFVYVTVRCRKIFDNLIQYLINIDIILCRNERSIRSINSYIILNLFAHFFWTRRRKINLVYYRKHLKIGINREINGCKRSEERRVWKEWRS